MNSIAFAFRIPARAVASVTILALLAWTLGLPAWLHHANAANVVEFSDTLSDSDLGAYATSTITWTAPNGMVDGQFFVLQFLDPDANGSNFSLANVEQDDLLTGEVGFTAVAACGVDGEIALTKLSATVIQGESCGTIASSTTLTIQVGRNDSADLALNPLNEGSYVVRLAATSSTPVSDTGDTRVYIIDDVTVTATVETTFAFTIEGVNPNVAVNTDPDLTIGTSTATSVPFGVLPVDGDRLMAQRIEVITNALNGYSVTVEADQTLTAGNGATIDTFIDGLNTAVPSDWSNVPAGTLGSTDTYGHWGIASSDNEFEGPVDFWDAEEYVGNFVGNPVEVLWHDTAMNDTGIEGEHWAYVGYKARITALQEAANDYTATLTYVATPVF